jgi:hypothetical protein
LTKLFSVKIWREHGILSPPRYEAAASVAWISSSYKKVYLYDYRRKRNELRQLLKSPGRMGTRTTSRSRPGLGRVGCSHSEIMDMMKMSSRKEPPLLKETESDEPPTFVEPIKVS